MNELAGDDPNRCPATASGDPCRWPAGHDGPHNFQPTWGTVLSWLVAFVAMPLLLILAAVLR